MTTIQLPAPTVCKAKKCDADILEIPTWGRSTLTVNARPDQSGSVHVHASQGHTIAQVLSKNAANGFRAGDLPLYRLHDKTCAAKAGKP